MNHKVEIYGNYAERVFQWFFSAMADCGGDGGSVMVCGNPGEAVTAYKIWLWEKHPSYKNKTISFSDYYSVNGDIFLNFDQESHVFTAKMCEALYGEPVFVIKEDCTDFAGKVVLKAFEQNVQK